VGIDVGDDGADGHGDDEVVAALAVFLLAHAAFPALRLEAALVAEVDQGVEVLVGLQPDAAAVSPVTAVGAALGNELLPPEAHAAVAALAGGHGDFGFVDEFHGSWFWWLVSGRILG